VAACGQCWLVQSDGQDARHFLSRCKCWTCPTCAPWRLRRLRGIIASGNPEKHLVLTMKVIGDRTPAETASELVKSFDLLLKRIKYHYKIKRPAYFYVIERHDSGEPHMHVLTRMPYIPQAWLSEQWEEITGASNVWIEQIKNPLRAMRYITKYLTKAPERFGRMKRHNCSKNWRLKKPLKPEHDWKRAETRVLKSIDVAWLVKLYRDQGWTIIRAGPDGVTARAPHAGMKPPLWHSAAPAEALPKRRKKADWTQEAA